MGPWSSWSVLGVGGGCVVDLLRSSCGGRGQTSPPPNHPQCLPPQRPRGGKDLFFARRRTKRFVASTTPATAASSRGLAQQSTHHTSIVWSNNNHRRNLLSRPLSTQAVHQDHVQKILPRHCRHDHCRRYPRAFPR